MGGKSIITFILLIVLIACQNQRLVCYSKTKLESQTIYKYFRGMKFGFFVDIYPQYPIVDSSTVYLKTQGWSGVNVLQFNQTLKNFKKRYTDTNILWQIEKQIQIFNNTEIMGQVCKKPINFMALPSKHIKYLLNSKMMEKGNSACSPQLILVKQYGIQKTQQSQIKLMQQKGYQLVSSYQSFIILIRNDKSSQFLSRVKKNIQNVSIKSQNLISFSSIVKGLARKVLGKQFSMSQLKSNTFQNLLYVHFATTGIILDITKFNQTKYQQLPTNIIIMQENKERSPLIMPTKNIKQKQLIVSQFIKFQHIIYSPPNSKQINLFIFKHNFINQQLQNNESKEVSPILQKTKYFNKSQIAQYSINELKSWENQTNDKKQTRQNTKQSKEQKEVVNKQQVIKEFNKRIQDKQQELFKKQMQINLRQQALNERKNKYLQKQFQNTNKYTSQNKPNTQKDQKQKIQDKGNQQAPYLSLSKKQIIIILIVWIFTTVLIVVLCTALLLRRFRRFNSMNKLSQNNDAINEQNTQSQNNENKQSSEQLQ